MAKNANGLGSIYFDKNAKVWRGSITLGRDDRGKLKRKTFTGKTQKVVKEKMDKFNLEHNTDKYIEASKICFADFTEYWFNVYKRTVAESSARSRKQRLNSLFKYFPELNDVYVTDVTPQFLEEGIRKLIKRARIKSFTEYYRVPLNMILNFAVKKEYFRVNPLQKVDLAQFNSHKRTIKDKLAFSEQENQAILGELNRIYDEKLITVDIYYYPFYLLMFWTGMRNGEVCALKWEDIDFNNRIIHICRTLSKDIDGHYMIKDSTKTYNERYVYMHDEAYRILKFVKDNSKIFSNDEFVFVQYKDKSVYVTYDSIKSFIKRACENAGIGEISTHFLRHNFVSMLINKSVPVNIVRDLVGHKDVSMTLNVYTHSNPEIYKNALDKLNFNEPKTE